MIFKAPYILLLIPVAVVAAVYFRRRQGQPALRYPSSEILKGMPVTWKMRLEPGLFYARLAAIVLFVIALAGPRQVLEETVLPTEGIDIVLAIDASGSMAAEDFTLNGARVNRLEVVKNVVNDFIDGRSHDRIGLVVFSALAYTVSPLTTDYSWLKSNLERVELGLIKDGTAIGSAISSSLSRLQKSKAKSKVIILLTDGMNNAGKTDPLEAAKAAQALGIKIYTIGAGTKGFAPFPVTDIWGRKGYQKVKIDIDEKTMTEIAEMTGARYFRATDTKSLEQIYREIDALEKTVIEEKGYKQYKELFVYFLSAGLVLLFVGILLENTLFLKIP